MVMSHGYDPVAMVGVPRAVRAPVDVLRLYIEMVLELLFAA
jgi:hypothetical protein